MFVGERMSHPVVTISPDMSVPDALQLMQRESIRRTPVMKDGKLVGIVSDKDLLNASPSQATSLSVWELHYLMGKLAVSEVMTTEVVTVGHDTPIEEAARIMADNKIGGLPVMREDKLVGIITETDLFRIFLELMGARDKGVRVTVLVPDKPGQLAALTNAIAKENGNFLSFGTFAGEDASNSEVTFKVEGLEEAKVKAIIEPLVEKVKDIRVC